MKYEKRLQSLESVNVKAVNPFAEILDMATVDELKLIIEKTEKNPADIDGIQKLLLEIETKETCS